MGLSAKSESKFRTERSPAAVVEVVGVAFAERTAAAVVGDKFVAAVVVEVAAVVAAVTEEEMTFVVALEDERP